MILRLRLLQKTSGLSNSAFRPPVEAVAVGSKCLCFPRLWRDEEASNVTFDDVFIAQLRHASSTRRVTEFAVKDIHGQATIPYKTDVGQAAQTSLPHDGDEVIWASDTDGGVRDLFPPPVPSPRGGSGGLSPPNKTPSLPNWNMKHYKLVEILSKLNVKSPLHERKA